MAKMLRGVGNEEIAQSGVLSLVRLPFNNASTLNTHVLVVVRLAKEAQIAWLQQTVDLVVSGHERHALAVLEEVAPNLCIAAVIVQNRGIAKTALLDGGLTIPELSLLVSLFPCPRQDRRNIPQGPWQLLLEELSTS